MFDKLLHGHHGKIHEIRDSNILPTLQIMDPKSPWSRFWCLVWMENCYKSLVNHGQAASSQQQGAPIPGPLQPDMWAMIDNVKIQ